MAGAQAFQGGNDKASSSKPKKQKTWAEPIIKGFDAAFIHPVKPKLKGWKKMLMVEKAAYVDKEQASKLGDKEMAEGDSASTEADHFWSKVLSNLLSCVTSDVLLIMPPSQLLWNQGVCDFFYCG